MLVMKNLSGFFDTVAYCFKKLQYGDCFTQYISLRVDGRSRVLVRSYAQCDVATAMSSVSLYATLRYCTKQLNISPEVFRRFVPPSL